MHSSLAVQAVCRNFRAQFRKPVSHPALDFTNIQKVYRYDTPGPMDNTWIRWLKLNYRDGTTARIDYGHTQTGSTFRDLLAEALATLGIRVSNK